MKTLLLRWIKFNAAGWLGIGVQIIMLTAFTQWVHYLLATLIAVEAAVLHNFVWHERLTWRDRTTAAPGALLARLVRFHLANGTISLLGNFLLMQFLVDNLGIALNRQTC